MKKLLFIFTLIFSSVFSPLSKAEGIDTYFQFCYGVQGGFGDQAVSTVLGGLSFLKVALFSVEYDLNRVAINPSESNSSIQDLLFVPNLKIGGTVYLYREKFYAPYTTFGLGIDLGAPDTRINLYTGAGIEIKFLKDFVFLNFGLRFYIPRPVDVERQREQMFMDGRPSIPSYLKYYNLDTYQLTVSIRFFY